MISAHTVYLDQSRTKAVKEGDKDARYLLVREGGEISDEQADKYTGARALIGGKKAKSEEDEPAKAAHAPTKETPRSDRGTVKHRDPRSR